jgi:hypothetical protein
MAAPVLGPRGRVYAVEPMADVFKALELNKVAYEQWAKKNKLPVAEIIPVHAGGESSLVHALGAYWLTMRKDRRKVGVLLAVMKG